MPRTASPDATSSGTVARVAMLLRVLADIRGEASLSEITEAMGLPASTTHRLLHLLMEQGFVERGQGSRSYRPGLEFLRVGGLVAARAEITEVAHGFMQAVVDGVDETCMLSLYVPRSGQAMVAKAIHGSHPLRYEAALYVPSSLVWGATGLGILAFLPPPVAEAIIEREGPSPADARKSVKPQTLRRELARIRQQGYAHTFGQKIRGAVGFSAPVFNSTGVVAALCITPPESRFEPAMEPRLARVLVQQAQRFSASLGWRAAAADR